MLSKEHISELLKTEWAARNLIYKEETGSTNDDAKVLGEEGAEHGTLVVADMQKNGRGSRGRSWETPKNTNIAMSLLIRPIAPPDKISMLTLVMGLSVAEGIEDAMIQKRDRSLSKSTLMDFSREILSESKLYPQIKWPNDIVLGGKKICGILTEMSADMDRVHYIIPGIGFNLNRTDFDPSIRHMASSVYLETGREIDRSRFVADYVNEFMGRYDIFLRDQDLGSFVEEYQA